jgi:hypothetical protein
LVHKELSPGRIKIDNDAVDKVADLLKSVFQNPFKEITGLLILQLVSRPQTKSAQIYLKLKKKEK